MPWTDPSGHVWVVGEVLTAANMNTYVEANLAYLYGDAGWTAPTYTNGWVDYGGAVTPVGFRRFGIWIELRGSMKSGTINTGAFVLPVGYRPPAQVLFITDAASAPGYVSIGNNGGVTPLAGSTVQFSLDGIHFAIV